MATKPLPTAAAIVCNTGPLIAIAAGTGSWAVLQQCPKRIIIPQAVQRELNAGGPQAPGYGLLDRSPWIQLAAETPVIPAYINAALDPGEAAVIATALAMNIDTVAIDERNARHVARSCGLTLTGSLGLLIQAIHAGAQLDLAETINRMRIAGVWISEPLADEALRLAYPPVE